MRSDRFLNIREDILLTAGKVKATQRVSYADAFAIVASLVEGGDMRHFGQIP